MGKEFEPDSAGEIPIHLAFTREMLGKRIAELEDNAVIADANMKAMAIRNAELEAENRAYKTTVYERENRELKANVQELEAALNSQITDTALAEVKMEELEALLDKESEDG